MVCPFITKAQRTANENAARSEVPLLCRVTEFTCLECKHYWIAPRGAKCPKCWSDKLESKARPDDDS